MFYFKFLYPAKKYFAGNYGFTLNKIESVVVVVVVVVLKSSERFNRVYTVPGIPGNQAKVLEIPGNLPKVLESPGI